MKKNVELRAPTMDFLTFNGVILSVAQTERYSVILKEHWNNISNGYIKLLRYTVLGDGTVQFETVSGKQVTAKIIGTGGTGETVKSESSFNGYNDNLVVLQFNTTYQNIVKNCANAYRAASGTTEQIAVGELAGKIEQIPRIVIGESVYDGNGFLELEHGLGRKPKAFIIYPKSDDTGLMINIMYPVTSIAGYDNCAFAIINCDTIIVIENAVINEELIYLDLQNFSDTIEYNYIIL